MWAWARVFAVLFVLPVFCLLFFFTAAPEMEMRQLRESFSKGIDKASDLNDEQKAQEKGIITKYKFLELCREANSGDAEANGEVGKLRIQDVCDDIKYFDWIDLASVVLIALGLIHLLIVAILAKSASRSREGLLASFRLAWRSASTFSLIILLGQTVLAAVTLFYVTVLLSNSYFPKLILVVLIAGGYAFYAVAKVLLSSVPLKLTERTCEEVKESAAPKLWGKVREIAQQLGTAPPDTILVGMTTAFFVTEIPVTHASGETSGRTLYLSAPMMQKMPAAEVAAIIGHELGHFKGEDTVLTRELSPMLYKSDMTLAHLGQAGLVGRPALQAMNVFSYMFDRVISTFRRERELHADAAAAQVTSNEAAALALVRYSFLADSYEAGLREHLTQKAALEASIEKFRDLLQRDDGYWKGLAEHGTPHPFDSHPPMAMRVEKLGYKIEVLRGRAVEPASLSAYEVFMEGKTEAISRAMEEHNRILGDVQAAESVRAQKAEDMDVALIQKHFPQVVLKASKWKVSMITLFIFLLIVVLPAGLTFAREMVSWQIGLWVCAAAGLYVTYLYIRSHIGQTLTFNHVGLQQSNWKTMMRFEDVANVHLLSQNGTETLTFTFKKPMPAFTHRVYFRKMRKNVSVNLQIFEGKQMETVTKIMKYYTRDTSA